MYETWYKMSVLVTCGVDISPVITHRYSYKEFEKGFEAMIGGATGKVILDWTTI
jgi:threonine 3-dehydrogenase